MRRPFVVARARHRRPGFPGRRFHFGCAALALALLAGGCRDASHANFPAADRVTSVFRVSMTTAEGESESRYMALDRVGVDERGRTLVTREFHDGSRIRYRFDAEGVVRVGDDGAAGGPTGTGDVLVLPDDPRPGREWTAHTRAHLLERVVAEINASQRSLPGLELVSDIPLLSRVVSGDEEVRTAAGIYRQCVRITRTGKAVVAAGAEFGNLEVTVIDEDWYAPGVGLVKSRRRESSDRTALGSATLDLELAARYVGD